MRSVAFFLFSACFILFSCNNQPVSDKEIKTSDYFSVEGYALGSTFHIKYENKFDKDYSADIRSLFDRFENSLSTYMPNSIISRINSNDSLVVPDKFFIDCFTRAMEISDKTGGAFDMTVAPLVNAWGFGFTERTELSDKEVKKMLRLVGYKKIRLSDNKIIKDSSAIMLDAGAIAPGQCVDVVCEFFDSLKISNYMIEIGGEVRTKGHKANNENWVIGIDKPIDRSDETNRELQAMISLKDKAVTTSGNYRQFYEKGGIRYSHTISPFTGYPVNHSLLSATVIADDCMTADAFATAFMVIGLEKSMEIVKQNPGIEVYFISSGDNNQYKIDMSEGFKNFLLEN